MLWNDLSPRSFLYSFSFDELNFQQGRRDWEHSDISSKTQHSLASPWQFV